MRLMPTYITAFIYFQIYYCAINYKRTSLTHLNNFQDTYFFNGRSLVLNNVFLKKRLNMSIKICEDEYKKYMNNNIRFIQLHASLYTFTLSSVFFAFINQEKNIALGLFDAFILKCELVNVELNDFIKFFAENENEDQIKLEREKIEKYIMKIGMFKFVDIKFENIMSPDLLCYYQLYINKLPSLYEIIEINTDEGIKNEIAVVTAMYLSAFNHYTKLIAYDIKTLKEKYGNKEFYLGK